jgi:uncharacterized lipoprotein YbaY
MTQHPEVQNIPEEPGTQKTESKEKNRWMIAAFVIVALILVGILAYAMLSASGLIAAPEPTQPAVFITITEPAQGTMLDTTWAVTVKGEAGGLFEGNVVVQALSASGEVLAQQPTTVDSPDAGIGGAGPWSTDLRIETEPGTQGQIVAFSTSPLDGSTVASDSVDVGFGESPGKDELVRLEDHLWMLASLNGRSLIENTLITLQFENFQASGSAGCNRYNTSYERRATDLNFGLVTSTAMECELPEGIMVQESAYFDALELVIAYRIENQQLKMFDRSNNPDLVYDSVVMGNIISSSETELPEGAVVYVNLSDISQGDAEAQLIAEQVITGATEFPIPFMVKYNPRQIVENHTYASGVRIEDDSGNLLFINPAVYHVINGEKPSQVDLSVEAVQ